MMQSTQEGLGWQNDVSTAIPKKQHEIERELRDPAPRRVRLTGKTQTLRWVLYNLAVISLAVAFFFCVKDLRQIKALQMQGSTIEAQIVDKQMKSGKNRSYTLYYLFTDQNHVSIMSHSRVRSLQYESVEIGDPLTITYLPENSEINLVGTVDDRTVGARRDHWGLGIGLSLLFVGGLAAFAELSLQQKLSYLRNGLPTVGIVTGRRIVPGKSTTYYVTYSYTMPSGGENLETVTVSRQQHDHFEPDKTCTVLMNPQNTSKSMPYFLTTALEVEGYPVRNFLA